MILIIGKLNLHTGMLCQSVFVNMINAAMELFVTNSSLLVFEGCQMTNWH